MEVNPSSIDAVLSQIREYQAQLGSAQTTSMSEPVASESQFSQLLDKTLVEANSTISESGALKKAYDLGDETISLTDVVIAGQKADVALQASIQVRNRLLSAYQDIMNMPV